MKQCAGCSNLAAPSGPYDLVVERDSWLALQRHIVQRHRARGAQADPGSVGRLTAKYLRKGFSGLSRVCISCPPGHIAELVPTVTYNRQRLLRHPAISVFRRTRQTTEWSATLTLPRPWLKRPRSPFNAVHQTPHFILNHTTTPPTLDALSLFSRFTLARFVERLH